MSLSSHLKDAARSPVGRYLQTRFPNTKAITAPANTRLRGSAYLPPGSDDASYPYSLIGMAVDYRLRYFFAATPARELVAWHGARALAGLVWSPDQDPAHSADLLDCYSSEEFAAFFAALDAHLVVLRPSGRNLSAQEDSLLARYCFVLGLLEQVFRSGMPSRLLFSPAAHHSLAELLAIADESWITDICQIGTLFYRQHADLLSRPFHLNPTFAGSRDVGGADADLIVDGCLIDIKTTKRATLDAAWLRQLVGYALLDYSDDLGIQSVGIYLARQGELLTWPLDALLRALSNESAVTPAMLRAEFHAICQCL